MASVNPRLKIAQVAARYVGTREESRNRGENIAKFWTFTNYKEGERNREPWCCAAVVAWIQMADAETELFNLRYPPKMASVAEFLAWAKDPKNGCQYFTPADVLAGKATPLAGDVAIMLPHLSHIGIIRSDYVGDGFVQLTEGNTNGDGSREGDGVYNKQRRMNFIGTYVRLPADAQPIKGKATA